MSEAPKREKTWSSDLERPDDAVEFAKSYLDARPELVQSIEDSDSVVAVRELLLEVLTSEGDRAPLSRVRGTAILSEALNRWNKKRVSPESK